MSELVRKDVYVVKESSTIEVFLRLTCTFFNRVSLESFASANQILLDGVVCTDMSTPVHAGSSITLLTPQSFEPSCNTAVKVLYEDEVLLVVNKPAPLPMHPAGRHYFNTLTSVLVRRGLAKEDELFPVHRLDRETSGVVVFAKSSVVAKTLSKEFTDRSVSKSYVAITHGSVVPKEGSFTGAISKCVEGKIRDYMCVVPEGMPSTTNYVVIDATSSYSLALVTPTTGRRHQIRTHFAHAGFPLVGDKQYGSHPEIFVMYMQDESLVSSDLLIESFGATRQYLHASTLRFTHPISREKIGFHAVLPEDMVSFCQKEQLKLRFND